MPRRVFDYEIIDCIGAGAGSLIYVVSHAQTQQLYALKHVVKREEKQARFIDQLENEYQISRQFNHPALRRAIEMRDDKTMFKKANQAALVMELFDGESLEGRARGDVLETLAIFAQVAKGLAALHGMGVRFVLCEGGPTLNGELAAADVLDELCLTIAPALAGGAANRGILHGAGLPELAALRLVHSLARDNDMFLRYRRADRPVDDPAHPA